MEKGLTYTSTTRVTPENTALTMGSGDLPVFATPAMVALMENAAMNAVKDQLEEGSSTVGRRPQLPQRDGEDTLHHRPVQGEERGAGDGDTAVTGDSG